MHYAGPMLPLEIDVRPTPAREMLRECSTYVHLDLLRTDLFRAVITHQIFLIRQSCFALVCLLVFSAVTFLSRWPKGGLYH